ncbi:MAG: hypothetical protein ACREOO_27085 [bacterium]
MPALEVFKILRYALGTLSITLGILIFAGVLLRDPVPAQIRYTFGAVLVLLGVYRLLTTIMRASRSHDA